MIEQEYGGFDEYIMTCPLIDDHVALMYRYRIRKVYEEKKDVFRGDARELMKGYGDGYVNALKGYEGKMDGIMLKECDIEVKMRDEIKIPKRMGLI